MKLIKYRSVIAIALMLPFVSSCLKDDRFNDLSKVTPTAIVLNSTSGKAIAYTLAGTETDQIVVKVSLTGANAPTHDVTLSLGVSTAALDLYNVDKDHVVGTLLPANAFSIPQSVTITAGKDSLGNNNRSAQFVVTLTEANVPSTPGVNYVLPIAITGAPDGYIVSGNQGAILYNFYNNPWKGNYQVTGTLVDVVVPTITGYYPMDMDLVTINAHKSYAYSNDAGGIFHPITSGGLSVYGNVGMVFTFDDDNNVVSVDDYYGLYADADPLPRGRTLRIDPTGVNKYDPVTKVMKVKYFLDQASTGPGRTSFDETWTFQHP